MKNIREKMWTENCNKKILYLSYIKKNRLIDSQSIILNNLGLKKIFDLFSSNKIIIYKNILYN